MRLSGVRILLSYSSLSSFEGHRGLEKELTRVGHGGAGAGTQTSCGYEQGWPACVKCPTAPFQWRPRGRATPATMTEMGLFGDWSIFSLEKTLGRKDSNMSSVISILRKISSYFCIWCWRNRTSWCCLNNIMISNYLVLSHLAYYLFILDTIYLLKSDSEKQGYAVQRHGHFIYDFVTGLYPVYLFPAM